MAQRLDDCFTELEAIRSGIGARPFGQDVHASVTRIMSVLHLKMVWVNELPYFIWQVDSPEKAARFLDLHRTNTECVHHRVSDRFGLGGSGELIEIWANEGVLSVDLAVEVSSYRDSHVDDTWSE